MTYEKINEACDHAASMNKDTSSLIRRTYLTNWRKKDLEE